MCADGSPMADLLASLRRWEELHRQKEDLVRQLGEAAEPLEAAARRLLGAVPAPTVASRYAALVGQDENGRVRFSLPGFGHRTFSLEELAGGS